MAWNLKKWINLNNFTPFKINFNLIEDYILKSANGIKRKAICLKCLGEKVLKTESDRNY